MSTLTERLTIEFKRHSLVVGYSKGSQLDPVTYPSYCTCGGWVGTESNKKTFHEHVGECLGKSVENNEI